MPPKKRKVASAAASSKHSKRVRIGSSSVIGEIDNTKVTASGRPKRASVGELNYDVTRRNSTGGKTAVKATKTVGRPPKVNAESQEPVTTISRGCPSKAAVLQVEIPKKQGRPKKEDSRPNTPTKTKLPGRPKKASTRVTTKLTTQRATTASTATATSGRGRPSKNKQPANGLDDSTGAVVQEDEWEDSAEEGGSGIEDDRQFWLMKAEPDSRIEKGHDVKFSIDDLRKRTEPEGWDGVRNPVARNNMRAMRKGDLAFFYHSNCSVPGIAGVMQIVQEHSIDESAFDPEHPYFDPKSIDRNNPKWELVHVKFRLKFIEIITLKYLKTFFKPGGVLENMQTLRQSRLSVSAVTPVEWNFIMDLGREDFEADDEEMEEATRENGEDERLTP